MLLDEPQQQFSLDTRLQQANGFNLKKTGCCWIASDKKRDRHAKLNHSSMLIWQICSAQNTVGDIISSLQEQYPEVEDIDKDIQPALDQLLEEGLISIAS